MISRGWLHLSIVYLVWGSTFLAIRVAVRGSDGFGPFVLSGLRVLAGGVLLLAAAPLMRAPIFPPRNRVPALAASGVLLWAAGHAALLFGARESASGTAAVLFGTTPLYGLIFAVAIGRQRASGGAFLSLITGLAGIVLLALPGGFAAGPLWPTAALVAAPAGWAAGSVLQSARAGDVPAITSAAWQQIAGGLACVLLAAATGEHIPDAKSETWFAVAYLIVPGCVPAFTSYVRALQLLPESVAMSFAYVNPVIAVLLGAWLLDEPLRPSMLLATILIAASVAGVYASRRAEPRN